MRQPDVERRATFRVAIRPGSGLQASFVIAGQTYVAKPGNLSANGMYVRPVDQTGAPRLAAGDSVAVELKYADMDLSLRGVICYRRDGGYGIHFPRCDADGYKNPCEQLASVASDLQRESVARRKKMLRPLDGSL